MGSKLASVTKGKVNRPPLIVVYGPDGVGKTTFAGDAPAPIFLGTERGSSTLDVARFVDIDTWSDVLQCVKELIEEKHSYQTLVIDSLDWLEPLIFKRVCDDDPKGAKTIEKAAGGYGKGYEEAMIYWRELSRGIERLRDKGMAVIMVAHSEVKTAQDPMVADYDRYQLALQKKGSAFIRQYADAVLFANFESHVVKTDDRGSAKGIGHGVRVLWTERRPAFDAKNRYGMPFRLPLEWQAVADAIQSGNPETPAAVKSRIEGLRSRMHDPETLTKIDKTVSEAGDNVRQLLAIENRLKIISGEATTDGTTIHS